MRECVPLFSQAKPVQASEPPAQIQFTPEVQIVETTFEQQKPPVVNNKWFSHPAGIVVVFTNINCF